MTAEDNKLTPTHTPVGATITPEHPTNCPFCGELYNYSFGYTDEFHKFRCHTVTGQDIPAERTALCRAREAEQASMRTASTPVRESELYSNPILNQRAATHGSYSDTALYSQTIKSMCRGSGNWNQLSNQQRESLDLFATKIARILSGNPDEQDHWKDIAGYATLVIKDN